MKAERKEGREGAEGRKMKGDEGRKMKGGRLRKMKEQGHTGRKEGRKEGRKDCLYENEGPPSKTVILKMAWF